MDKIVGLLILLVLFTGCAAQSTNTVDYNHPSTIQEENYASYEDWVEEELSVIQYYTDCTNQDWDICDKSHCRTMNILENKCACLTSRWMRLISNR